MHTNFPPNLRFYFMHIAAPTRFQSNHLQTLNNSGKHHTALCLSKMSLSKWPDRYFTICGKQAPCIHKTLKLGEISLGAVPDGDKSSPHTSSWQVNQTSSQRTSNPLCGPAHAVSFLTSVNSVITKQSVQQAIAFSSPASSTVRARSPWWLP